MKQAITIRVDPDLLRAAKLQAAFENRTLTNFLETLLRVHLAGAGKTRTERGVEKRSNAPEAARTEASNIYSEN